MMSYEYKQTDRQHIDDLCEIYANKIVEASKNFHGKDIAIWGVNEKGIAVKQILVSFGYEASFYISSNPKRAEYCGLPVCAPDILDFTKHYVIVATQAESVRIELTDIASPEEYKFLDDPYGGYLMLQKLLQMKDIHTVLDVGSGGGVQSGIFAEAGFKVTAIDYGKSPNYRENPSVKQIIADFNQYPFGEQFDCVWCSHVLEHQVNPGFFLKKIHSLVKEGGYAAISVPPMKQTIVPGHVSLWNIGLLLYHLVLAGFDCSKAQAKSSGYNLSVLVQKNSIDISNLLCYDFGDLDVVRKYLPDGLQYDGHGGYWGSIKEINW